MDLKERELTYYEILGVRPDSPPQELEETCAFLLKVLDSENTNDPQKRAWLKDLSDVLQKAFQVLRDPVRREEYNKSIKDILSLSSNPPYFKVLGLEPSASDNNIMKAYRTLAKVFHPDKFKDPRQKSIATARFRVISAAKKILRNPEERRRYIETLKREAIATGEVVTPKKTTSTSILKPSREDRARIYLLRGMDYFSKSMYSQALDELSKALSLSPSPQFSAECYFYLARSHLRQEGGFLRAAGDYKRAISNDPKNIDYRLELARSYKKRGMNEAAKKEYKGILEIDPNHRIARREGGFDVEERKKKKSVIERLFGR